ncbi:Ankyrin repeat domain-containing protein 17 [Madurella fahalii]|uniref:Ankyrin repeat domain-containing protein 17 n=1 Tax=Madurella fahalii TaxID=1157608 RepID=A0ABQ0GJC5_9PEZI
MPKGTVMSLPNETLLQICGYLDEPDLRALTQANRRLSGPASLVLWDLIYTDPARCKEVLLWAVEAGHHEVLRTMLERGTDPNFYYLSSLLRSRLMDLFAAQGGQRGTAAPRDDRLRKAEVLKEKYCRNGVTRRSVRHRHEKHRDGIPLAQDFDWHVDYEYADHHGCSLETFGIVDCLEELATRKYWSWSPIHVAVLRGDNDAVRLLLDHGANIDARCSGLCDCAGPDVEVEDDFGDSIMPNKNRPVWTPLHVAICTGNEDTARLLITLGASNLVGVLLRQKIPWNYFNCHLRITALQSAAWLGSVQMCKLLLEHPGFDVSIDRRGRRGHVAIHYAAAAGHIRTVGKLLLENGALFPNYKDKDARPRHVPNGSPRLARPRHIINDPLRQLCMQHKYDDARWLVSFCRRLYTDEAPIRTVQLYSRALAALCSLRKPVAYSTLTLRQKQDRLLAATAGDTRWTVQREIRIQAAEASRSARLSLARLLLKLGANPNLPALVPARAAMQVLGAESRSTVYRTSLQIAAYSGFAEMVNLLLDHGADCNLIGGPIIDPSELPVMLAAREPPHKAYWNGLHRNVQWIGAASDHQTMYTLLDRGASLDDVDGISVLQVLPGIGLREFYFSQSNMEGWLRIAEVLLQYGAASKASEKNWKDIIVEASRSGYQQLCKMLWTARPISPLPQDTLNRMLLSSTLNDGQTHLYRYRDDPDTVRWVLQHCVRADGRLLIPISRLREIRDQINVDFKRETRKLMDEFIQTME